ncbi:MAG: pyridoxal phosphate-dependent aminotransferase, partial [Thermoplasmata archaeon]
EEEEFKLLPERIEEKITDRTKLIIINSPCNPTGTVLNKRDLKNIADICLENEIFVISDEIYEKIIFGEKHISIASLPEMKKITITVNGFSKAYSMTGFRLGYAAAPEEIINAMKKIQEHSVSCATSFVQKSGVIALREKQKEVEMMVREFRKRRDKLMDLLLEIPEVSCVTPKGTFYAFPNFSFYSNNSIKFAKYLLEKAKVATIPGVAFGKCGEGFLRISFATSLDKIVEGIERIERTLRGWKQ